MPQRLTLRRLGQRLMQAGLLHADQLRSALVEQRKERVPLGQLLVRDGLISQQELDEIIGMQVAEDLFALFTWRHGTFEFFKGDAGNSGLRSRFENCPEYEVNSLLLEVARRSDEWQSILEELASLDEVPRQIARPADEEALADEHRVVLETVDGLTSYRQLADRTTIGLFEFARAARDLSAGNILANIDDSALVANAEALAEEGEAQRAILTLQTLRDRPGDRSLGIVCRMAEVLKACDERRLASELLLEAAQRSTDPDEALACAREARALVPYDPGTLSFLRTTLLAHCEPDSSELEKCTLDLLDALIDGGAVPTALEILEDARRTGSMSLALLNREARARQKAKDTEGAVECLLELAEQSLAGGQRQHAIDAYRAILRLDRNRKDVERTLIHLQRTRLGKIVRLLAALLCVGMVSAMGVVWYQQHSLEEALQRADDEVQGLLDQGDHRAARVAFDRWHERLGENERIQDIGRRVVFAEAAERNRKQKLRRAQLNDRLTEAAAALGAGELDRALTLYAEVHGERGMANEVRDIVQSRLAAVLTQFQRTAKAVQTSLPPAPDQVFDRAQLTANLASLQRACPPALLQTFDQLSARLGADDLPPFVPAEMAERLEAAVAKARPAFEQARELGAAYTAALQRNDTQRRLDPMFKAAVAKEAEFDFVGALELYRQLEQQPTGDADLRAHFRDRVARNATIARLLEELHQATRAGDFATSQQHLRALRKSFPEVPFDTLVQLPLSVRSLPSAAEVLVNGKPVGRTPLLLSRVPNDATELVVRADGFAEEAHTITGDGTAEWRALLLRHADARWPVGSAIDTAPVRIAAGDVLVTDRSGRVTRRSADLTGSVWAFASDDLSGWLTRPVVFDDQVLVGSLDGPLRALGLTDGKLLWQLEQLPTEVEPSLLDGTLFLATTDGNLHAIDLEARTRRVAELEQPSVGRLLLHEDRLITVGARGVVECWSPRDLTRAWRRELADLQQARGQLLGDVLVLGDDQGHVVGIEADTGAIRWQRNLPTTPLGHPTVARETVLIPTPERLLRLRASDGRDLPAFAPDDGRWTARPLVVGARCIVPHDSDALFVMHADTGALLYRLAGNAESRMFAPQGELFTVDGEHLLRSYGVLR
ncbi:MAG TPA: PEGA domain-containing protein [bacterium]|nr:PEGA domain-containing protein [bacterium]